MEAGCHRGRGWPSSIVSQRGGGTFAFLRQMVPVDHVPKSLVVRDLDGDQRLDITVDSVDAKNGDSAVTVFLNRTP